MSGSTAFSRYIILNDFHHVHNNLKSKQREECQQYQNMLKYCSENQTAICLQYLRRDTNCDF